MIEDLKQLSQVATSRVGKKKGRSLHITGAACLGNFVVGVGKLILGIISLSLFTCVGALYTFGMVTAKCFALAGIVKQDNSKEQYWYYKASGLILIIASLLYIIYSIRLFVNPINTVYDMNVALLIATFTFTELVLNIRGVIIERHNHSPLVHAIKMINLASSLICLVLTQAAILSFADTQFAMHASANGLLGIIMGGVACLLGVVMIIRIGVIQKRNVGKVVIPEDAEGETK